MNRLVAGSWVLAALVCCTAACTGASSSGYVPPTAAEPDSTLGHGDTFEVTVYGQEDLSGKYRVAADGTIDFPLVGAIEVAGKDQGEVADAIRGALQGKHILNNPHVSVLVLEMESKRVTILGAVDNPGSFNVTAGLTVVQAISLAGGFTQLANQNGTIVTRRVNGKIERFKVPVERITEGRSDDVPVLAGDTIYVPERLF